MQGKRLIRIELHLHTFYSPDCSLSFEDILTEARRKGLDALAVTDHNRLQGALEMQRLASMPIIAGEEVRCLEGELIGLFLHEEIPGRLAAREVALRIKEQGGVICVPHPFDRLRRSRLREDALLSLLVEGLIDVVEVANARVIFPSDNLRARRFAEEHGLAMSGGSDAHSRPEIGQTFVEMPAFADRDSFLEALRLGRVVGRASSPLVHAVTIWEKWRERRRSGRQS